jgi:ribonuclease HII
MKGTKPPCADWSLEDYLGRTTGSRIAGVDEVGRGAWAGNMVAAAAVYKPEVILDIPLRDSKAYRAEERLEVVKHLTEKYLNTGLLEIVYAEVVPTVIEVSNLNDLNNQLFNEALSKLKFDKVIIDGNIADDTWSGICAPKADEKSITVATASLFAKVYRDTQMLLLDQTYPQYGFKEHVGYGTKKHAQAILEFGAIKGLHRHNFLSNLRKEQQ